MTVEQLAEAAGVATRQISRVEVGRASPSILWLLAVAHGLDITPSQLIAALD